MIGSTTHRAGQAMLLLRRTVEVGDEAVRSVGSTLA